MLIPPSFALRSLAAAALLAWTLPASAQTAGTLKTSFDPAIVPPPAPPISTVQVDGKILLGTNTGLLRLNTDGSVDAGFNASLGSRSVAALAAGPNLTTAVIITSPTGSDDYEDYQLLRLLADGTVDPLFTPAPIHASFFSTEYYEFTMAVQLDGKVIVAGYFIGGPNPPSAVGMVRYNADGSLDPTFNLPSDLFGSAFNAVVPQADGRILIAGKATENTSNSTFNRNICFLNADGSVDESYQAETLVSAAYAPTLLPDGKIVYLQQALRINGEPLDGGVPQRLNADGSPDTSFAPQFPESAAFTSLVVQSDGKLVVGGYTDNYYTSMGGVNTPAGIARLNVDGTTDASFDAGTGADANNSVNSTYVAADGSIIVVGTFANFDGQPRPGVAELNGDGGLDLPFFDGEVTLSNGVYYQSFASGNPFGYYAFLSDPHYLYHFDLGYEYVFPSLDGSDGVYLYDFASQTFFYTSPEDFPFLYDFTLGTFLYYYPDPSNPGRYNTDGVRYFYDFATGQTITK